MLLKARGTIGDRVEWWATWEYYFLEAFCLGSVLLFDSRTTRSSLRIWSILPHGVELWRRQTLFLHFVLLGSFAKEKEGANTCARQHLFWVTELSGDFPNRKKAARCPHGKGGAGSPVHVDILLPLLSEWGVEGSSPDSCYTGFPSVVECLREAIQITMIRASTF